MIEILTKDDVEELNGEKNDQYYIPGELFTTYQATTMEPLNCSLTNFLTSSD